MGGTFTMSHKPCYAFKIDPAGQRMAKIQCVLSHLNAEEKLTGVDRNTYRVAFLQSWEPGGKV